MFHIHIAIVIYINAFRIEQTFLRIRTAERKRWCQPPLPVHDPVAGHNAGLRIDMQRIPDRTRRTGIACKPRDLSVRSNFAARYLLYDLVYLPEKIHALVFPFMKSGYHYYIIKFSK